LKAVAIAALALTLVAGASASPATRLAAASRSRATSPRTAGFRTPTLAQAHAATVKSLRAKRLRYEWVACVKTDHRFRGATVVRCNVNFGIDPHIVAFCTVLHGADAVTQFELAAIPCGPDLSGPQFTITSSSGA
jgi:hypothetical protein